MEKAGKKREKGVCGHIHRPLFTLQKREKPMEKRGESYKKGGLDAVQTPFFTFFSR